MEVFFCIDVSACNSRKPLLYLLLITCITACVYRACPPGLVVGVALRIYGNLYKMPTEIVKPEQTASVAFNEQHKLICNHQLANSPIFTGIIACFHIMSDRMQVVQNKSSQANFVI